MKEKKAGFWQWVKNIFKKRPLICTSIVSVLFAITYGTFIEDGALSLIATIIPYILFIFWLFILTPYKFIKDKRPLSKKINIFNFIAWLIVVLGTIGLPLIGIVAYNGMANSSKAAATKTNHSQTIKYISAELQKCILGESTAMDGRITCSGNTAAKTVAAAVEFLPYLDQEGRSKGNNPYAFENNARRSSTSNTSDSDVGYISLSASGSNIIIKSCHRTPCNKEANRQSSTVSIK